MWQTYYQPTTTSEALALLAEHGERARVIAGGTDLILELERGVRSQRTLIDITRIPGLGGIELDEAKGEITLGPLVTHNDVVASPLLVERAFPLARACWEVGAPQIRNRGTVAGNLITASPANDTITPLWALDGAVTLVSQQRGSRRLPFDQFFKGVRRTALEPDEMLAAIHLRALPATARGLFIKLGLRRAQAISLVNVAVVLDFDGDLITAARITLGSVAPTIVRAREAEASLVGRPLSDTGMHHAAELAVQAAHPIDDVRATADYRASMVGVLVERALRQLRAGTERAGWPARPVLLRATSGRLQVASGKWQRSPGAEWSGRWQMRIQMVHPSDVPPATCNLQPATPITFTLNGQATTLEEAAGKTLLRALREDAGMHGVKEGCAEGECGACTVWLDGEAVMACLVPAERAQGCDVVTIEGLATDGTIAPGAGRLCLRGRSAVRLLHAGPDPVRRHAAGGAANSHIGRYPASAGR